MPLHIEQWHLHGPLITDHLTFTFWGRHPSGQPHLVLCRARKKTCWTLRSICRMFRGSISQLRVNSARGMMAFAIDACPPAEPTAPKASFKTRPAARTYPTLRTKIM